MHDKEFSEGSFTTPDATPVQSLDWDPQDNAAYRIEMHALARERNGPGRAAFKQTATISKEAGVVTASGVGAQEKVTNASAATWALAASIQNNRVVAHFTGEAGKVVDGTVIVAGMQVGPF
jgi:hypothetical protein